MNKKKIVKKILIQITVLFLLPFLSTYDSFSISPCNRSSDPGLIIDLNITTGHRHHDRYLKIFRNVGESVISTNIMDINNDGNIEVIMEVWNSSSSPSWQKEIWLINGDLNTNRSIYSASSDMSDMYRWTIHDNKKIPVMMDIGKDDMMDLVLIEKGNLTRNGSVEVYLFEEGNPNPWPNCSYSINISSLENGTVASVQALDLNGDGSNELVVHKEISYVYTDPIDKTNHTKLRTMALIIDGDRPLSGDNEEDVFSTRLYSEWIPGQGNDSYRGMFSKFFDGSSNRILGSDWQYYPLGGGEPVGRVFLMDELDLSEKTVFLKGNITDELSGPSLLALMSVHPIRFSNPLRDDILVDNGWFKGIFLGMDLKGKTTDISESDFKIYTTFRGVQTFCDFNGDQEVDIVCGFSEETLSDRTNCGVTRIELNARDLNGHLNEKNTQDVNILGPESVSMAGRNIVISDVNKDGASDLIIPVLWSKNIKNISVFYIIMGRPVKGPKVERIIPIHDNIFRGEVLKLEVFGSDPQNMPKYLRYELQMRIAEGNWLVPTILKNDNNFSYDRPYDGSKTYHIDIPKNSTIGNVDLKVRATNTFGISSVWYEFDSIASVLNHPPSVQYPWLDRTVLRRTDRLNVSGAVKDLDDDGTIMLSVLVNDTVQTRKVHEGTTLKDRDLQISLLLNESYTIGPNYLVLEVIDPSGAIGRSVPLRFEIIPGPLSLTIPDPGQVLRGNDIVIRPVFTTEINNVTLTIMSDPLDTEEFVLNGPGDEIRMNVPLHSGLGVFTAEYVAYDGYWNDSGSFQFEILNNIPFITLPDEVQINGTGSLSLISMLGDKEDGRNVSVSLMVLENGTGSSAVYDENERKLILEVFRDGIYDLKVTVTDRDGGSANDTLRIIGNKALEPTGPVLKVTVMDEKNDPIQGATVNILKDGSILSSVMTDINGSVSIELPENGVYLLRVSPPNDRTWISGSRSGLMNKELTVTIPPYEVELILEWKNASQSGKCSLVVVVVNGEGSIVQGAGVSIDGPDDYHDSTNATGQVLFLDIEPGTYSITASYGKMTGSKSITLEPDSERTIEVVITTEKKSDNDIPWYYFLVLFLVILFIGLSLIFMMSRNRRRDEEE